MLESLSQIGLNTTQFLALLIISAIAVILGYRRYVLSIFDPLNLFLIAMIADFVLMYGLNWDSIVKIDFTVFVVCFWIGFTFVGKTPTLSPQVQLNGDALLDLELVLLLVTVLIVVANLYLVFAVGAPLLSANPAAAKVTTFTGGLGIIRHVNQGPYLFLCCGCSLMIAAGRRPMFAMTMLIVSSAFVALGGSKGALLPVLFVQAFVSNHSGLKRISNYSAQMKKLALPAAGAAVAVALIVVTRANGGLAAGILSLGWRLLLSGDVILFYYPLRGTIAGLAGLGPFDYFHYLFDPILAMLRLVDYQSIRPPLGSIIGGLDSGFGPNAQYFVRADIFFGPVLGSFYCLALGYLTAILRRQFFIFRPRSAMVFTFSLLLAVSAVSLPLESSLFVSGIADVVIFIVPMWCLARVANLATTPANLLDGPHVQTKS
jgi:hypothetical protein